MNIVSQLSKGLKARNLNRHFQCRAWLGLLVLGLAIPLHAQVPDLTAGGVPSNTAYINLGPTGMEGWIYNDGGGALQETAPARQILVTKVDSGSPANGILAVGDVILGASGTGAAPVNFTSDARKSLALAINDAEGQNPALLKLLRWRSGVTSTVSITLEYLGGSYTATAPYHCPKSAAILEKGVNHIMNSVSGSGYGGFGTTVLLAANNPSNPNNAARQARAQTEAYQLNLTQQQIDDMTSGDLNRAIGKPWSIGPQLITQAEYFLQTGDSAVLPSIRARAIQIANAQSIFGTMGHHYSLPGPNGEINGPYGIGYGPVNNAGMPCFLGLILAGKCGLADSEITDGIARSAKYFAYYADLGTVPYGENKETGSITNNGKSGLAALTLGLVSGYETQSKYFAKLSTFGAGERDSGHTGPYFNHLWTPLGSNVGGQDSLARYFNQTSWLFDLCRRWNGSFVYQPYYQGGGIKGYGSGHEASWTTLLTYAAPMAQLYITGKNPNPALAINATDMAAINHAIGYNPTTRTTTQLLDDLKSPLPQLHWSAGNEIGANRAADHATILPTLITMATSGATYAERHGAIYALGKIANDSTAALLAGLCASPNSKVRYMAANALKNLSMAAKTAQAANIVNALVTTDRPLLPLDAENPMHAELQPFGSLLFDATVGIWGGGRVSGADRALLYPAFRIIATAPMGGTRESALSIYQDLTRADVENLADVLVEVAVTQPPGEIMYQHRANAIGAMQTYNYAEGVPASIYAFEDSTKTGPRDTILSALAGYGASNLTVVPDPGIINFCELLISNSDDHDIQAQAVLDAIANDPLPTVLTPFKSIDWIFPDAASVTLPADRTMLRLHSTDLAKGDSSYTWRKVHGAGKVTFTPNGTGAAKDTLVVFDGTPGVYTFEVTMSDTRRLTETSKKVSVTLYQNGGTLPSNSAPTANAQAITVAQATPTQVILSGSDPEGLALNYSVISAPAHGHLSGSAPYLVYTAHAGYTGADSISFEVMDSEGHSDTAVVSITVNPAGAIGTAVYEPFDYPAGLFNGSAGATEIGLSGSWNANSGMKLINGSLNYGTLATHGGSIGNLTSAGSFGGSRAINPAALGGNGLLADGATLWISAVMGHPGSNYGQNLFLALANSQFTTAGNAYSINNDGAQLGSGVGISMTGSQALATHFRDSSFGGGTSSHVYGTWSAQSGSMASYGHRLVVAKITWGASSDTIEIYLPNEDMVLPSTPSSLLTLNVAQSTFDTLTFSRNGAPLLDEIRIGASYHSVQQGTVAMAADITPPTPNPMSFAVAPVVSSPSSITMTAATAHDLLDVEYHFTCTAGGGNNSGWQDSPIYTDSGLTPGVQYSYTVKVRDKQPGLNETAPSTPASATIPASATVPNVVGALQASAQSLVTAAGLAVGTLSDATAYSLSVPAGHVLSQTPAAGSTAAYGTSVDLEISIGQDPALPTLAAADMVDGQGGGPVVINHLMTYTLTFSEDMNDSTVAAADFVNAGNAAITIGTITETSPGVFSVEVTPTSTGLLRLAVAAGAALQDAQGDALNTTHAIIDDTVVTVNLPNVIVPNVVGMDQPLAEAAIVAANLVVGTIRQIYEEVVPLGDVYSQDPVGGSLPGQYPVNLVISAGPPPDTTRPLIVSTDPVDGAYNIEVDANLVVTFDEHVFVNTGNIIIRNLNDGTDMNIPVSDPAQALTYTNKLTINPAVNLAAGKSYAVRIPTGAVVDASGNAFLGISDDFTWNFSTALTSLSTVLFSEDFETPNVAAYAEGTTPSAWVRANQGTGSGSHGLTDKAGGDFSAPDPNHQAYAFRYTNSGITTAAGVLGPPLAAGGGYEVSFDVVRDDGGGAGKPYTVQLIAFAAGALRNDCRNTPSGSALLASATGNAPADGSIARVSFTFVPNAVTHASSLGMDLGIRLKGATTSANIDNVRFRTVSPSAGDQVPPAIASLTPTDDSTQVSVIDNLAIVFDENIAVNAGYITLKNLTTTSETRINVIDGTKVLITDDTLQINPAADLDTNTFYAVRIDPGAIVDLAGNAFPGISDDITWTFNTGDVDDSAAPMLVSVSPADGTTGMSYSTSLSMTFGENVVANAGSITLKNLTDSTRTVIDIADSSQVSVSGTAVTITPSSYLGEGKTYAVWIDSAAILDLAGNPYAGIVDDLTWNFTTSANNPPAIVAFNPVDEAVGVNPGASIKVTFDENIAVGAGNITLRNLSNPGDTVISVTDTSQVSVSGSILTINPSADLPEGKVFAVLLQGGALLDLAGNAFGGINSEATWNFATGVSTQGAVFLDDFEAASGSPDVTASDSLGETSKKTGANWVRATNGFGASQHGIVDESSGQFNDPNGSQAYAFRYTNSGITLAQGKIGALAAGKTYRVSFYVVKDGHNNGDFYRAELVTFAPGGVRTDADTGQSKLLAFATGSYNGDSYQLVTLQYTSNATADAAVLGHDVALRFIGATTSANIDNVMVRVESPVGPLDHFAISPITSTQTVGTPITGINVTAQDAANATVTGFTGTVTFGGSGGFTGTSASFTAGVLTGVSVTPTVAGSGLTLTVDDGASHTGSATIATILTIQTPYTAWSSGAPFDADTNGDGVNNGLAFLLGAASPTSAVTQPTVTQSGGSLILNFNCLPVAARGSATLKVVHSNNLTTWTATTGVVPDTSNALPDNHVTFLVGAGPAGPPALKNVTATIGSAAASSGKLYGRLVATQP